MKWSLNSTMKNLKTIQTISFLWLMILGGCAMSADIIYQWEWPAERSIQERMLVKITSIKKQGSGFFGVKKSPSIASNFPDPVIVEASLDDNQAQSNRKTVQIVVPKLEVETLEVGQFAMFGIVDTKICICIVPLDSKDVDLSSLNCS